MKGGSALDEGCDLVVNNDERLFQTGAHTNKQSAYNSELEAFL